MGDGELYNNAYLYFDGSYKFGNYSRSFFREALEKCLRVGLSVTGHRMHDPRTVEELASRACRSRLVIFDPENFEQEEGLDNKVIEMVKLFSGKGIEVFLVSHNDLGTKDTYIPVLNELYGDSPAKIRYHLIQRTVEGKKDTNRITLRRLELQIGVLFGGLEPEDLEEEFIKLTPKNSNMLGDSPNPG